MAKTDPTYTIIGTGDITLRAVTVSSDKGTEHSATQKINQLWAEELFEKGENLFNGDLLNFESIEKTEDGLMVSGHFVEYKQFIAQRKDSTLDLGIHPIGVSGILILHTTSGTFFVFGKRASSITQYPEFWELIPSGSIDKACLKPDGTIDVCTKLKEELIEETGVKDIQVKQIQTFALVYDKTDEVYDICCEIQVEAEREEFLRNMQSASEYTLAEFVPIQEGNVFLEKHSHIMVPTSLALMESYLKWKKM